MDYTINISRAARQALQRDKLIEGLREVTRIIQECERILREENNRTKEVREDVAARPETLSD